MGLEFNITTEIPQGKPNVVVLRVDGWLDAHSEGQLVEAVQKARAAGAAYVLIDLGGVSTITSAGIRAIQKSFGIMTPKGRGGPRPAEAVQRPAAGLRSAEHHGHAPQRAHVRKRRYRH